MLKLLLLIISDTVTPHVASFDMCSTNSLRISNSRTVEKESFSLVLTLKKNTDMTWFPDIATYCNHFNWNLSPALAIGVMGHSWSMSYQVSGPGPPWASCAVHCAATCWWLAVVSLMWVLPKTEPNPGEKHKYIENGDYFLDMYSLMYSWYRYFYHN